MAQKKTVSGQVTRENSKEALPGVTVSVKGAKTSTATNNTGNFTITVPGILIMIKPSVILNMRIMDRVYKHQKEFRGLIS